MSSAPPKWRAARFRNRPTTRKHSLHNIFTSSEDSKLIAKIDYERLIEKNTFQYIFEQFKSYLKRISIVIIFILKMYLNIFVTLERNRQSSTKFTESDVLQQWTRATTVRLQLLCNKNLLSLLTVAAKKIRLFCTVYVRQKFLQAKNTGIIKSQTIKHFYSFRDIFIVQRIHAK